MKTFGQKVVAFNKNLSFNGKLPQGFKVLNPFMENPETMKVMSTFYDKFYGDNRPRKLILAINPGRLGAGTTGVPFTDTKRLEEYCGVQMLSAHTHEVSALFVYDMIKSFGGVEPFYNQFYINSVFPLAIVRLQKNGNWVNANYYDDKQLFETVKQKMIQNLEEQVSLGVSTKKVFVLGKKNATFIQKLNEEIKLFNQLEVLEHPRYIQQYKTKEKEAYIEKYIRILTH